MATIAVFIALGGASYAATQLPANSVGTKQIEKEAVTPGKLSEKARAGLVGPQGATGPAGTQGVKGDQGLRGPSDAYYAHSRELEGERELTFSLKVPPGSYVVSGSMWAYIESETGWAQVSCRVYDSYAPGGHQEEAGTLATIPPAPTGATWGYAVPSVEFAINVGEAKDEKIGMTCAQEFGTATAFFYQPRLTATRVETLTKP